MLKYEDFSRPPKAAGAHRATIIYIALLVLLLTIAHITANVLSSILTARFLGSSHQALRVQSHDPIFVPGATPTPKTLRTGAFADVRNSTLGFQKIFVISSTERTAERDMMTVAASLTGISFEIVEGVRRQAGDVDMWRSKMNVIRKILEEHLESVLILDDNVEWDISLKAQLEDFARGSRFISSNIPDSQYSHSPYGENWDVLWLGHCGAQQDPDDTRRFLLRNDPTVPPPEAYESLYKYQPDMSRFDNSSRLVYQTRLVRCHSAVGISYSGAQRTLATMAMQLPLLTSGSSGSSDVGTSSMCEKGDLRCIASHPAIISQLDIIHDIEESMTDPLRYTDNDMTKATGTIVRGVKGNLLKLVRGKSHDIRARWQMPALAGPLEREYLYQ